MLRDMDFPINEIRDMLSGYSEDIELLDYFVRQRSALKEKISYIKAAELSLDDIIKSIRRMQMNTSHVTNEVQEKTIEDIIFAGFRFKGKYNEVGSAFKKVGRIAGRHISGSAMSLYYDHEYRETDADIEAGFPVSKTIKSEDITCRVLQGGRAATIVHKGPYDNLGKSYSRLFAYIEDKKYKFLTPSREIYLKGPGMILKGNPDNYLTEIQVMID